MTKLEAKIRLTPIIAAAEALLDAMEMCHICEGSLIIDDVPSHCEDCSWDCDDHEEPNCTPIRDLHRALRKAIQP